MNLPVPFVTYSHPTYFYYPSGFWLILKMEDTVINSGTCVRQKGDIKEPQSCGITLTKNLYLSKMQVMTTFIKWEFNRVCEKAPWWSKVFGHSSTCGRKTVAWQIVMGGVTGSDLCSRKLENLQHLQRWWFCSPSECLSQWLCVSQQGKRIKRMK